MGWWQTYLKARKLRIPTKEALRTNQILSMIYFFSAWNALALGIYYTFKEKWPKTEEEEHKPSKFYARILATKEAKAIRISGFHVVNEYDIESTAPPERGRTYEERIKEMEEQDERDREEKEREKKKRQALNLLVEETNSL